MITIVDYGSGNIGAIERLARLAKIETEVAEVPDQLRGADRVLLPGVGAFDSVMASLDSSGMGEALLEVAQRPKTLILGICVGMHALARSSEEGDLPGLGLVDGVVRRFDDAKIDRAAKSPHMGWNSLSPVGRHALLKDVDIDKGFYFLHNYYFQCTSENDVLATTHHGAHFHSFVGSGRVLGVQFHPEKSHSNGMQLLKNYSELRPC